MTNEEVSLIKLARMGAGRYPVAHRQAVLLLDIIRPTNETPHIEMRPSLALQAHRQAIREIALRHRVRDVRVFGSALHGSDTEDSDLDLLVEPTAETTLMDIARIQIEVAQLLHVGVDVLTPNALPDKFRAQVMAEAVAI
ncbi:MAG: DNA polymerase beta domain-containing protein [Gallionellaceae bacterium]|nr:MAG: DNA polymerase beta domain-containing protein [Gallionellaceae bacterium]